MVRRGFVLVLLAALATTACSPPISSHMGVSVDADGNPVGVVAVCGGYTNVADVMVWERPATSSTSRPVASSYSDSGQWVTDQPVTELGTWSLVTGDPWTVRQQITLLAGYTYYLTGTGRNEKGSNDTLSIGIEFTLADIAALEPGQVRYPDTKDPAADTATYAVVPLEEFRAAVCG